MDKVYAPKNMEQAWQKVRSNKGASGVDGMTIGMFAEGADERLRVLQEDLRQKTYRPQPVRRVYIEGGGKKRPIGIPTVRGRIVEQSLQQVLSPIFEAKFSKHSHGFRPEKGCATALKVVDQAVKHGYQWVVVVDIRSFFDTVDHEILMAAVNEEVSDGSVLRLIRRILTAGVIEPGVKDIEPMELETPARMGTPQGGPLSPLLANIYLHTFDEKVVAAGYGLVRYADDLVIFTRSESEAEAALLLVREILEGELRLKLHPEKTQVVSVDEGFEFLGYHYYRDPKNGQMRKDVRQKSVQRFREAVRERTPRITGQRKPKERHMTAKRLAKNARLKEIIRTLNLYLRGWHWYFKAVWSPYEEPFRFFDSFVRRRVRAALVGRVGSGWWNVRITNSMLRSLGLIPLESWQEKYLRGQLDAPVRKGRLDGEPYAGKPHVRFGRAGVG
jgi:RNA-directed DNA polymerase